MAGVGGGGGDRMGEFSCVPRGKRKLTPPKKGNGGLLGRQNQDLPEFSSTIF